MSCAGCEVPEFGKQVCKYCIRSKDPYIHKFGDAPPKYFIADYYSNQKREVVVFT